MFDDSSDEHDGAEDDGAYAADGEVCFEVGVALPEGVAKWFSVRHARGFYRELVEKESKMWFFVTKSCKMWQKVVDKVGYTC